MPFTPGMLTRRQWLSMTTAAALTGRPAPVGAARRERQPELESRIARVIRIYGAQGFHRTATGVDRRSGEWLCDEVRALGLAAVQESFIVDRIDPTNTRLIAGGREIEGLPLFDGAFTNPAGIRGRVGLIGTDAEIAFVEAPPNTAAAGELGEARRQDRYRAIVCATRGSRPGLCPHNADSFLQPFGPPVVQVSSEEAAYLHGHAQRGTEIVVVASVARTHTTAFNVVATIRSKRPERPPLVVMTPRSGWYYCASERGGGIACWLEMMRTLLARRPARDVVFVASSGHELGHLGIDAFVAMRPELVRTSVGWIHLGANIGAAVGPGPTAPAAETPDLRHATPVTAAGTTIQASDDAFEGLLSRAMETVGLRVGRRNPRGTIPGGEAEVVHRGGGRYLSVIGSNALFHNPADRGPQVADPSEIARFSTAFGEVAQQLLAGP